MCYTFVLLKFVYVLPIRIFENRLKNRNHLFRKQINFNSEVNISTTTDILPNGNVENALTNQGGEI